MDRNAVKKSARAAGTVRLHVKKSDTFQRQEFGSEGLGKLYGVDACRPHGLAEEKSGLAMVWEPAESTSQ